MGKHENGMPTVDAQIGSLFTDAGLKLYEVASLGLIPDSKEYAQGTELPAYLFPVGEGHVAIDAAGNLYSVGFGEQNHELFSIPHDINGLVAVSNILEHVRPSELS